MTDSVSFGKILGDEIVRARARPPHHLTHARVDAVETFGVLTRSCLRRSFPFVMFGLFLRVSFPGSAFFAMAEDFRFVSEVEFVVGGAFFAGADEEGRFWVPHFF